MRSLICLALLAGLATAALADQAVAKIDGSNEKGQWTGAGLDGGNFGPGKAVKGEEAGQKANTAQGGQFGPDSYMFWKPQRQLLNNEPNGKKEHSVNERGGGGGGGSNGPDSWMYWKPQRQLLATGTLVKKTHNGKVDEAGQKVDNTQGGQFGPDSYMFWKPQRQLLAEANKQAAPATTAPQQTAFNAKKPESAPKQAPANTPAAKAAPAKTAESAPKGQQQVKQAAPKNQNERGFRGWAWGANSDLAGFPGGGQAYPLMNTRNIYTAAGWGGSPTTCAQGGFAHACSTRKMLLKLLRRR